ncbi:hypothetical protein ACSBR2_005015 [Camellia fascicularis]
METNRENKMEERENERKVGENQECDACLETNTSFLAELNLIFLTSFFSLSAEECLEFEEREIEENDKYHEEKDTTSRLQTRRRGINHEFKGVERRATRFQTKIRDCRHCRRM